MDSPQTFLNGRVTLHAGDCLGVLPTLDENSVDSCVTDPPYHLASIVKRFGKPDSAEAQFGKDGAYRRASAGFMGKVWDGGDIAFRPETWAAILRVLKPGAHLVAFAAPKNAHRMFCAIEDGGFEIRDTIAWLFGSGFPKSHNLKEQWQGWGTALKPAYEPICLARKPLVGTVAANVLKHGTGAINIDGCRVDLASDDPLHNGVKHDGHALDSEGAWGFKAIDRAPGLGRWPANCITDGSDEVVEAFPETESGAFARGDTARAEVGHNGIYGRYNGAPDGKDFGPANSGSAARFFYTSKADKHDRITRYVEDVVVEWISESGPRQVKLQVDTAQSLERAIVVSASTEDNGWSTFLSGDTLAALFRKAYSCTTSTAINSTTGSKTWNWLTHSLTSVFTGDVKCETGNGGSPVENVESGTRSLTIMLARTAYLPGVTRALLRTPLRISVRGRLHSHPTCKPLDLIQYLCRLITPPGGTILDCFAGTGTTAEAAWREGFNAVLIEREPEYLADIERRMSLCLAGPDERARESIKARQAGKPQDHGPLFDEAAA